MSKKAVLFDLDGTLANTHDDVWHSIDYAAAAVNKQLPLPFRSDPQNLSLSIDDIWRIIAPDGTEQERRAFKLKLQLHYDHINPMKSTVLYPGINDLLTTLKRAGNLLYIVTNKKYASTCRLLRLKKWDVYFDSWYCPDGPGDWQKTKTDLIAMLLHHKKLPLSTPYIGDSASDVIAAKNNGLPVIGVTYGDGSTQALIDEKPDIIVHNTNELKLALCDNLNIF